jgi:tRNA nucleotidyltransferase (CCA-adding enzyme)
MEVITSHTNADFDALASMLAAKKIYPDAVLVFPGSKEKSLRNFLIQSTLYTFEIGKLKGIDLDHIDRLILVDIRDRSRIGKFAEIIDRGVDIHIYDHHTEGDIKGSLEIIKTVGSTTTILTEIIKKRGIKLTPEEATILMLGIHEDTGSLTFPSTTEEDYLAAGFLLSKGADLNIISEMLTKELTIEQISLLNEIIRSSKRYIINGIEVVVSVVSTDRYVNDVSVIVGKYRDMENLNAILVIIRMEERIYLIGRSRTKEVDVRDIAAEFDGGGHSTAASATIKGISLAEAEEKLINILHEKLGRLKRAKDIMSFPAKSIDKNGSIKDARELLIHYNINVLPVLDGDKVVGLISRQVVEKALYHGLENLPVKEYMNSEFSYVDEDTPLYKIKELIINNNQKFLPVLKNNRLIGVITRVDILRILKEDIKEPSIDFMYTKKRVISKIIDERVPENIKKLFRAIGETAERLGYNAYVVGGFVRDMILRYHNFDVDIVIEGDGIGFANEFAKDNNCKIRSNKRFGTSVIIFPDKFKIDVATARIEYYKYPGALPTVEMGSLKLDLNRRDFTINTLAIRLNPGCYGELIDFFGGLRDIKDKIIRVLHNLSFVEDPTRILRALRFEKRFEFHISKHTLSLIKNAVNIGVLEGIGGKRIFGDLKLILEEEDPFPILKRVEELKVLNFIPLLADINKKIFDNISQVISWFNLLYTDKKYERWLIYFLILLDPFNEKDLSRVLQRLEISEKYRKWIMEWRKRGIETLNIMHRKKELRRSEIYNLLSPLPVETILYIMAKTDSESVRKDISLYFTQLKDVKREVSGKELKKMGLEPGPIYKKIFDDVLNAKLDKIIVTKEDEIEYIKKRILMQ